MALATFSWSHLGAWVQTVENLSNHHLDKFASIGGRWIAPVLWNDQASAPRNRELLPSLIQRAHARGIRVGAWINGFADPPAQLAAEADAIVRPNGPSMAPVIFDFEQHYKDANAPLMPETLAEFRKLMPTRPTAVTSFGYADRAMIWNGRTLSPPASFYDQKVRWIPQWYYGWDGKYAADWSMADLKTFGAHDFNIRDADAPGGRGIPLGYAHGVFYVTGIHDPPTAPPHELAVALEQLKRAKAAGFTFGFSIYVLERTPDEDFARLAGVRGTLYK